MRLVFDTNVVVSACFWRGAPFECLARWARGDYAALVSPPLLVQYEETRDELRLDYRGLGGGSRHFGGDGFSG